MSIEDLVVSFNTTPFLFIGSGLTRRYYNLPSWEELLIIFAKKISDDEFIYNAYKNKAEKTEAKEGIMPKIAELIQKDFDEKWFRDKSIRTSNPISLEFIKKDVSPFKVEVAEYIKTNCIINEQYNDEINKLVAISEKSISGIITTNYDCFLEDHIKGYKKYVGQNELLFSAIQGIAEIYKIHGSVEKPESIVINEDDYFEFNRYNQYLAAKLMTIFVEYPIIFIGYSVSDSNIQNIIKALVDCLNEEQLNQLRNRFIFIEYEFSKEGYEISPFSIMVNGIQLKLLKITLSDFSILYNALAGKKSKLPVRLLRRFKEELYSFVISNKSTGNLVVAGIDDNTITDDNLVLAIGSDKTLGVRGLSGIDGDEWYRNIIIDDISFSADELLEHAFPKLTKQNSGKIPFFKFLAEAKQSHPEAEEMGKTIEFDNIISNSIKKNRKSLKGYKSVSDIWTSECKNLEKATRLIAYLEEEQIDVQELENVLKEIFTDDANVLKNNKNAKTNIRRLVRIYDCLKYKKNKKSFHN